MNTASNRTAATALAFLLAAGCASAPENTAERSNGNQVIEPASDRSYKAKRLVTKGAHFGWVTARSVYENPINRPVSHLDSGSKLCATHGSRCF